LAQPKHFWANVRTIGQAVGYTDSKAIKVPSLHEIEMAMLTRQLSPSHIMKGRELTEFGKTLMDYFTHRADVLNTFVEPRLMNAEQAAKLYTEVTGARAPTCLQPMNKQKGEKKSRAYLTCIINALIEQNARGCKCDYDPRELTTVTKGKMPLRTLARRVDGAFPSVINPIAVWEIKEYYYTTTFGSRVADGVYETLLDGLELEELRSSEGIHVRHYLMVDAHYTWWECGRSYLCRIIDMLHMGYVDEVLFGREVVERLPSLVRQWVKAARVAKA
jgi:hypothetical protein